MCFACGFLFLMEVVDTTGPGATGSDTTEVVTGVTEATADTEVAVEVAAAEDTLATTETLGKWQGSNLCVVCCALLVLS